MTFLDLQTLTSDILDDTSNGYFTLTILKQRLNLALRELQKRLISANEDYYTVSVYTPTVVDQQAYALPSDFLQIIRLEYVQSGSGVTAVKQKIDKITPNERGLVAQTSGDPQFYFLQQNYIMLVPVPSRIVTVNLDYSYAVADMVNTTDVPDCPPQFAPYIAYLCARDCMVKDGRGLASIQAQLDEFTTLLKQIAVQRTADGTRMVTITEGGW